MRGLFLQRSGDFLATSRSSTGFTCKVLGLGPGFTTIVGRSDFKFGDGSRRWLAGSTAQALMMHGVQIVPPFVSPSNNTYPDPR